MNPDLRRHLEALVSESETLDAFSAWFWGFAWELESIPPDERDTVLSVENMLAQVTGGHIAPGEFFSFVRGLVAPRVIVIPLQPQTSTRRATSSSSGQILQASVEAACA